MLKDKLYRVAQKWTYRKFNNLGVWESDHVVELRHDDDPRITIHIYKELERVFYYEDYMQRIINVFPMQIEDFELLLCQWIDEKFKVKINNIYRMRFRP
jgi:hypothetical protein